MSVTLSAASSVPINGRFTDPGDAAWLPSSYFANRANFPPEELRKYAGRYVAFSWDGSQVVASGDDEEMVESELLAKGVEPSRVVFSYVDPL